MSDLFNFLTTMALDPHKQARFEKNPTLVMAAEGLAEGDQAALHSRNKAKISGVLVGELETKDLIAVMGGCYLTDPGPDPEPDPDPIPDPGPALD